MNTKIIATIGPKTEQPEVLLALAEAGATVARLNFTHGTYTWFADVISKVHKQNQTGKHMAVLLDTKGPEIRTAANFPTTELEAGEVYTLGMEHADILIDYDHLGRLCEVGQSIQLDGGKIHAAVVGKKGKLLRIRVGNTGTLASKKHINVPGVHLDLPILSEKDKQDIAFGIEHGIHCIAASFVSSAEDIAIIRTYVESLTDRFIPIIAKIESQTALDNLDSIIATADGVMIARGDLAVETSFEVMPVYQRLIIDKCRRMRTPVIMATQMLASMVTQPSPTRAEVSDVGYAIYEGVDAIMLSDETTIGAYPEECVATMRSIATHVERDLLTTHPRHVSPTPFTDDLGIGMLASCKQMAMGMDLAAIVLATNRIDYITYLSQERLKQSIIVLTDDNDIFFFCQLLYGVTALRINDTDNKKQLSRASISTLLRGSKLVTPGQTYMFFADNDGNDDVFDALYVAEV